ncbi:hypothetical protein JXA32_11205 [Candidatus Sumerlaeota bacterium]|nr:hypothetical protein [Candidatus Sumerlaeota bacterium]
MKLKLGRLTAFIAVLFLANLARVEESPEIHDSNLRLFYDYIITQENTLAYSESNAGLIYVKVDQFGVTELDSLNIANRQLIRQARNDGKFYDALIEQINWAMAELNRTSDTMTLQAASTEETPETEQKKNLKQMQKTRRLYRAYRNVLCAILERADVKALAQFYEDTIRRKDLTPALKVETLRQLGELIGQVEYWNAWGPMDYDDWKRIQGNEYLDPFKSGRSVSVEEVQGAFHRSAMAILGSVDFENDALPREALVECINIAVGAPVNDVGFTWTMPPIAPVDVEFVKTACDRALASEKISSRMKMWCRKACAMVDQQARDEYVELLKQSLKETSTSADMLTYANELRLFGAITDAEHAKIVEAAQRKLQTP